PKRPQARAAPGHIQPFPLQRNATSAYVRRRRVTFRKCRLAVSALSARRRGAAWQRVNECRVWSLTGQLGADDVDVLDGGRPGEQLRGCRAQWRPVGVQVSLTVGPV